ncbi:hypothetical protein BSLG_010201 [Batrachochytrium salamandrivorans]|nr:hypothetical protein BSLG_010201 [Batrachochytrium salamandrivorans]
MFTFPRKFQPASKPTTYSYITRVAPTAICTALDISFSNASLHYISLSFYTMIKSSTPVWVLVFAFLFGLEKPQWKLVLVILVICSGVVFTVAGEIRFSLIGFLLILSASVMSGLRWSLTQILLQNANMGMDNPVATLRYLSPVGAVLIGLMSCFSEFTGPQGLLQSNFFSTVGSSLQTLAILMAGALLAFCMTLAEYYLIRNTSVVTLSVIGISKEICIISLSVLIFGDLITPIAFLGIVITIGGIAAYHRLKTHDHGHIHVHRSDIIPLSTAIEFERSE